MIDIILSSPLMWLYLLYVAALLVAFVGRGNPDPLARPKDGDEQRRPRTWSAAGCHEVAPLREVQAACSAEYAARFSAAIRRIRNA
jgi:hypothetical protein